MSSKNGNNMLHGLNAILEYMEISRPKFYDYVEIGLPARIYKQRWLAHKVNIDDWFKRFTRYSEKHIPTDAE